MRLIEIYLLHQIYDFECQKTAKAFLNSIP